MNVAVKSFREQFAPWSLASGKAETLLKALQLFLSVYGAVVLLAFLLAPLHFLPAEDVVILHQYSRNLAQHGAITYYAGGPHAEGATDFGWMLLLAGAVRLGVSAEWFTAVVNVGSLLGLAIVFCQLARVRPTALRMLSLCGAAGLLPQAVAAVAGFPVLPFALLLTLLIQACLLQEPEAAALFALALSLFRPDGVVFAVPLLLTLLSPPPKGGAGARHWTSSLGTYCPERSTSFGVCTTSMHSFRFPFW